jgi:hypothetical protein
MKQLGINSEVDTLAKNEGLEHWSCTDPIGGRTWLRSDGLTTEKSPSRLLNGGCNYTIVFDWLKYVDTVNHIGVDWR